MRKSAGRDEELELLYRRQFGAFVRVASTVSGDVTLGHEAVQEAFARAIEGQDGFRGEGRFEAWVWRIVVNTAKSARERSDAELWPDLDTTLDLADDDPTPVQAWVRALPERERLMVFLRYWADLDYRSIASVLDVEVGTVSATLNAAHRTLRRSFEEAAP